jgi:hypothetical protein
LIQHLSGLAKRGVRKVGIDESEVGVIQQVECLGAKLKPESIDRLELTPGRQI